MDAAPAGYTSTVLSTGDVLSDRYRLDEPVADGGMGQVWRATDVSLGRTVAVKVLRPALLTDPGFDARFRAEARTMAALTHPNVVNVYDYGRSALATGGDVAFLVMAYVDGEPLSRRIADAGRLPTTEAMSVVAQAAEALHAAHLRGIVHRDVKPANLLIQPSGMVTLVDFGVARSAAVTQITTANAILGTAMYMAPEQASGRQVSPATDIYALGAVAYHCLAGHPPFDGDGPLQIALRHVSEEPPPLPGDIPLAARTLVERAMAKDPADRHATAAELAAAARSVMAGRGAVAAVVRAATARAATARAIRTRPAITIPAARAASDDVISGVLVAPAADTVPAATATPIDPASPVGPAAAAAVTEPASPDTPDTLVPLGEPARRARKGPRVAVVAGAAAALLLALVGIAALISPGKPTGRNPAGGPGTPGAPAAPATTPARNTDGSAGVSGTGPAVPVRASNTAAVPPPATTAPAAQNPAPAPVPTTQAPPTQSPPQPPTTPTAAPSSTASPAAVGSPGTS
ncbi:MAG TPA: serine/threonine-protein kinase [Planosporangium sp.]|jgi:serine/threonine-protein kinase|nr:serine/threonine-protein kinase [Planosporangium sp.]